MATVNELVTALGFELEPNAMKNIERFDKAIAKIQKTSEKLAFLFVGAKGAMDYLTGTVMKDSQEMVNLSKTTGYSIEQLQKWKYAAEASGVSADSVTGDLETLRKQSLMTGEDVLDLADRLASMDRTSAMQWASRLGISDDTLNMLRQGRTKIESIMGEAYVIPGSAVENTAKLNQQFAALKTNLLAVKNEIFMGLAPTFVGLLEKFHKWVVENKEWIKLKVHNIIEGVSLGFERFVKIIKPAAKFVHKLAKGLGLITDKTPEVETIANIVTGALLLMTGTHIITGMTTLAKVLIPLIANGLWYGGEGAGLLLANIDKVGFALTRVLWPISAIISGIDMVITGIKNLISGNYENNILENIVKGPTEKLLKKMGVKEGVLYKKAKELDEKYQNEDWYQAAQLYINSGANNIKPKSKNNTILETLNPEKMILPQQNNTTNSNSTYNNQKLYMTFTQPVEAVNALGQLGFNNGMLMQQGAFGGNFQ